MGCDSASKAGIGRQLGITGQRVGQIENEMKAKSEPKLLNHGEKKATTGYDGNILPERGNSKPYIMARLERDGYVANKLPKSVITSPYNSAAGATFRPLHPSLQANSSISEPLAYQAHQ